MELKCSLPDCLKDVVGKAVLLSDQFTGEVDLTSGGFLVHIGVNPDTDEEYEYLIMHPVCFLKLFNEFMLLEQGTILLMAMGPIGDLKAGLGISS